MYVLKYIKIMIFIQSLQKRNIAYLVYLKNKIIKVKTFVSIGHIEVSFRILEQYTSQQLAFTT